MGVGVLISRDITRVPQGGCGQVERLGRDAFASAWVDSIPRQRKDKAADVDTGGGACRTARRNIPIVTPNYPIGLVNGQPGSAPAWAWIDRPSKKERQPRHL